MGENQTCEQDDSAVMPADRVTNARSHARRSGAPKGKRTLVLGIMMSGTAAACISQSMMITALPTIMVEYGVDATLLHRASRSCQVRCCSAFLTP